MRWKTSWAAGGNDFLGGKRAQERLILREASPCLAWSPLMAPRRTLRDKTMTIEQVAEAMGLSKARVRQIEVQALQKLRRMLRQRGLDLSDFIDVLPVRRHDHKDLWGNP